MSHLQRKTLGMYIHTKTYILYTYSWTCASFLLAAALALVAETAYQVEAVVLVEVSIKSGSGNMLAGSKQTFCFYFLYIFC